MPKAITKQEITTLQEGPAALQLIDIRTPEEFERQHVPGSVNIPSDQLDGAATALDRSTTLVCICNKGHERSQRAAELLNNKGFEQAYYLEGGVADWFTAQ